MVFSSFVNFVESLDVFAVGLGADGKVKRINQAASKTIGYSNEELQGKNWSFLLFPGERRSGALETDGAIFGASKSTQCYLYCQHKSGQQIPMAFSYSPLRMNGDGNILVIGEECDWMLEREKCLRAQVKTDPLTNTDNRVGLDCYLKDCQLNAVPFALICIWLDKFNGVSDGRGHEVGDWILQQCASRMRRKLRRDDEIARVSGEEFTVVCPGVTLETQAMKAAQAISNVITRPFAIKNKIYNIGLSMGVLLVNHQVDIDHNALLPMADRAMHRARKKKSRMEFAKVDERDNVIHMAAYR